MKNNNTKWLAIAVAGGLIVANSVQAQYVTGQQYLSNVTPTSYSGLWNAGTTTSVSTGLTEAAAGGASSFSTLYYAIPVPQQTTLNSLDTQYTFDFTWNSGTVGAGGVNVLFALDDSLGGTVYYATGYFIPTVGLNTFTGAITAPNLANIGSGALINGLNFQLDPGAVTGNYSITFNSINLQTASVPEPSTLAIVGLGAVGLLALRRRNLKWS